MYWPWTHLYSPISATHQQQFEKQNTLVQKVLEIKDSSLPPQKAECGEYAITK